MLPINNDQYKIILTDAAFMQAYNMLENDYTLEGLKFRLKIGGKGCDGFTYETGFSEEHKDDNVLEFHSDKDLVLRLLVDPFTAHYCRNGELDFHFNPNTDQEGFAFINNNEHEHEGKFFKDTSLVPEFLKENKK